MVGPCGERAKGGRRRRGEASVKRLYGEEGNKVRLGADNAEDRA